MIEPGWAPVELVWRDQRPRLLLRDLRGVGLDDPFFEQTVLRARRAREGTPAVREVALDALDGVCAEPPSGLIFHGSRCGSTLLTSMLRALDGAVALSEVAVVEQILRAPMPAARRGAWLRAVVRLLGRLDGGAARLFLKLDSWSIHELAVVRAALPAAPWVFLYREPGEVLRSQLRMRGMQMVPGALDPERLGLDRVAVPDMSAQEYCARVLQAIYREAADGLDGLGLLVHYEQLPEAALDAVLAHFGIVASAAERVRMRAVADRDAKCPSLPHDAARPPVPDAARTAARRWTDSAYRRLEGLRVAQRSAVA